jgi:hypothetical protein
MPDGTAHPAAWPRVLAWAAYLACSWTWCIGMFLPVLLVRDYGPWGFIVFAIPNCLGAAVSGIAMRDESTRHWFLQTHFPAAYAFSMVTIAFQAFFAGWISAWAWTATVVTVFVFAVVSLLGLGRKDGLEARLAATLVATLVSIVAAAVAFRSGLAAIPTTMPPIKPALLALAPVCALGFALCPYFDLTFWRVRKHLPGRAGTAAFLTGFLVIFPGAILLTLGYSGVFGDPARFAGLRGSASPATTLLFAHIFLQLWVTVLFHSMELVRIGGASTRGVPGPLAHPRILIPIIACACFTLGALGRDRPDRFGLPFNELVYRAFMAFYGLVFPAYAWLCIAPTWGTARRPPRSLATCAVACAIAAPMFWLGFIGRREIWLLPGVAIVVLARLLIPRPPSSPRQGSGEPPEPSGAPVPVPSRPPSLVAHAIPDRAPPESPDSP